MTEILLKKQYGLIFPLKKRRVPRELLAANCNLILKIGFTKKSRKIAAPVAVSFLLFKELGTTNMHPKKTCTISRQTHLKMEDDNPRPKDHAITNCIIYFCKCQKCQD